MDIADQTFSGYAGVHAILIDTAGTYGFDNITFDGSGTADVDNASIAVETDTYSESNGDSEVALTTTRIGIGQGFEGDGGVVSRARFSIRSVGSPTGNIRAKVYAHTGTVGVSGIPTGSALATSNPVDASTVGGSLALVDFEFEDQFTVVNTTDYFLTIEYGDASIGNEINVEYDGSSPTHSHNYAEQSVSWTANAGRDLAFHLHTGGIVVLTITGGGTVPTTDETATIAGATIVEQPSTLTLAGLVANTEVRAYRAGTQNEVDGVENSGTSFGIDFDAQKITSLDIVIHHINYVHIRLEAVAVVAGEVTIPIQQRFDNSFSNPD